MKSGIAFNLVFESEWKSEPLDPAVAAEYDALPRRKDGTVSQRSARRLLPLLMYFDLLTLVHKDEWAEEGAETTRYWPERWGFPRG